jgi:hypothetical protein
MAAREDSLIWVRPSRVLRAIVDAIPAHVRKNLTIVGSLAVGYHFEDLLGDMGVRTKDAHCLLSPRVEAVDAGRSITEELMAGGWRLREDPRWGSPGDSATPTRELPVVRLIPPQGKGWFIELLTVPDTPRETGRSFTRLETGRGHFALPSFGNISLTAYDPIQALGISLARPEALALANMMEHPVIGPETMSGHIAGRKIKRSNKDLGRVLAIAHLSELKEEDALLQWPNHWRAAFHSIFPQDWQQRARVAGQGMRRLLHPSHAEDFDEAHHSCVYGLLAAIPPTREQLRVAGERLVVDAIENMEESLK